MMRALTDGLGQAFYSAGKMLVVLTDEPEPEPTPQPTPGMVISQGGYSPLNAFIRRTTVRKHR